MVDSGVPPLPLAGTDPDLPPDDLAPVLEALAGAEVIGLGEPTHGTREAFLLKHRLVRGLAEADRLRTVAFECGLAPARRIDAYVRFGLGDARVALAAQRYWCWEVREVLNLLRWLRAHNARLPESERIRFVGIDVQRVETGATALLATLGTRGAEGRAGPPGLAEVLRALRDGAWRRGAPEAPAAAALLREAEGLFTDSEERAMCRNLARHVEAYLVEGPEGMELREGYLAESVLEHLQDGPGPTVVWAHNEHVAANPDFFGCPAMGRHLREALGDGYAAVGMLAGRGRFRARDMRADSRPVREFRLPEATPEHVEARLAALPPAVVAPGELELDGAPYRRFLGALYSDEVQVERAQTFRIERPVTDFDLLAWLPATSPSTPLR